MYRAKCNCGKSDISRQELILSWVERVCKKCKSHLNIYLGNQKLFDCNNLRERRQFKIYRMKLEITKKQVIPNFVFIPSSEPINAAFRPYKEDVFMGYFGTTMDMDIDI